MKQNHENKWPIFLAAGLLCLLTFLAVASWTDTNPLQNRIVSKAYSGSPFDDSQTIHLGFDDPEIKQLDPVADLEIESYVINEKPNRTRPATPKPEEKKYLTVPAKTASYVKPLETIESLNSNNRQHLPIINEMPKTTEVQQKVDPENPFGDTQSFDFNMLEPKDSNVESDTSETKDSFEIDQPAQLQQPKLDTTEPQTAVLENPQKTESNSTKHPQKLADPAPLDIQKDSTIANHAEIKTPVPEDHKPLQMTGTIKPIQHPSAIQKSPTQQLKSVVSGPANETKPQKTNESQIVQKSGWPIPTSLIKHLQTMQSDDRIRDWCVDTIKQLNSMGEITDPSDEQVTSRIESLYKKIKNLDELIIRYSSQPTVRIETSNGAFAGTMKRIRYQLIRRLDIWSAVHRLAISQDDEQPAKTKAKLIGHKKYRFDQVPTDWAKYLELEKLESKAFNPNASWKSRKRSARKTLARATSNFLNQEQFTFVSRTVNSDLVKSLRVLASEKTNLYQFLADLEAVESQNNSITQYYLNDHYLDLYWSNNATANQLADVINAHYRNANVRFSISESLLNRLVPTERRTALANERFGTGLIGNPSVDSKFRIDVQPDAARWRFRLETKGWINSRTRAYRESLMPGSSEPLFNASKDVTISPDGQHQSTATTTNARTLLGSFSRFDRIPVYGLFARRGKSEFPIIATPIQSKIETATRDRFEDEVQTSLQNFTTAIKRNLIDPISAMELEPTPIEMKSTDRRIIMRYRLAGHDQMSAFTPRPMALKNSVMSCQIHESAVNNFIAKTLIGGKKFTLAEFASHFNRALGGKFFDPANTDAQDVDFVFANADPIRLDFDQHRLVVTLRLKRLRVVTGVWKNITVTSAYDIQAQGLRCQLKQAHPGINLKGQHFRLRDQLAVRTVFQNLLNENYSLNLNEFPAVSKLDLKGLWISQLVLVDGWLGVTINDATSMKQMSGIRKNIR